jgi:hypothetical protein
MMMAPGARQLLLMLAAAASMAGTAGAEDASPGASSKDGPPALDCKRSFEELKQAVTSHPGAMQGSAEHWDLVQIKSAGGSETNWWIALYVLTQQQHYAYPMITRKLIWKEPSGKVMSERTACGYGDKGLFDKVMGEFAALDKQMTDTLEKEHPKKPGE